MTLYFSSNKESCLAITGKLWISHLISVCLMISVGQAFTPPSSVPSATSTVSIQINGIFVMGHFDESLGCCQMSPGAVTFKWCNIVMYDRSPHVMLPAEYEGGSDHRRPVRMSQTLGLGGFPTLPFCLALITCKGRPVCDPAPTHPVHATIQMAIL